MHLPDGIAIPFDQQTAAMGAEGIFTLISGNVTAVNIFQSRCFTDSEARWIAAIFVAGMSFIL